MLQTQHEDEPISQSTNKYYIKQQVTKYLKVLETSKMPRQLSMQGSCRLIKINQQAITLVSKHVSMEFPVVRHWVQAVVLGKKFLVGGAGSQCTSLKPCLVFSAV